MRGPSNHLSLGDAKRLSDLVVPGTPTLPGDHPGFRDNLGQYQALFARKGAGRSRPMNPLPVLLFTATIGFAGTELASGVLPVLEELDPVQVRYQ